MKKIHLSALGIVLFSSLISVTSASDGNIAVSGVIAASTCSVTPGSATPLAINLGNYMASDFPTAGSRGNTVTVGFNINLCPLGTQIAYQFDGVADTHNASLFKVTEGDAYAKGIGLEVKTVGNGTATPGTAIFDVVPGMTSDWSQTTAVLNQTAGALYNKLSVTPVSTLDAVIGGKLDTTITMTFKYN